MTFWKKKVGAADILLTLFMLLLCFTTLYPFLHLFAVSFSPIEEVIRSKFMIFPQNPTLNAYRYVFTSGSMNYAYQNTIIITVAGTLINLLLSSLGAFVLSQTDLPGRRQMTTFVVIAMVFNAGLIPTFLTVKGLGLVDSLLSLMLPNAINTYYMLIMRNFFQSIPTSLSESARIDGATEVGILFRIILPLSAPILATLALFYGVAHWNEYFGAIIYLNDQTKMPLQVIIRSMYQSATITMFQDSLPPPVETLRAATIMVATVPILLVYPFLQRYFVQGMMVGAVKG